MPATTKVTAFCNGGRITRRRVLIDAVKQWSFMTEFRGARLTFPTTPTAIGKRTLSVQGLDRPAFICVTGGRVVVK